MSISRQLEITTNRLWATAEVVMTSQPATAHNWMPVTTELNAVAAKLGIVMV